MGILKLREELALNVIDVIDDADFTGINENENISTGLLEITLKYIFNIDVNDFKNSDMAKNEIMYQLYTKIKNSLLLEELIKIKKDDSLYNNGMYIGPKIKGNI